MFLYVQTFKNDVRVSISLNPFSYVFSALSYMICFGHKSFSSLGSKIGATVVPLFSFRPACGTVDNVLVKRLVGYGRQGGGLLVKWCNRKG